MTDDIVRVALERDGGIIPCHPRIEDVMQEQVCQERADDPALWRSRLPRNDATILHLNRHLQPALDVEPHPSTVRMMAKRSEQQPPIDAVEVALDVDVSTQSWRQQR